MSETNISEAARVAAGSYLGAHSAWCHDDNGQTFKYLDADANLLAEAFQQAIDAETRELRIECQDWQDELTGAQTRIRQLEEQGRELVEALKASRQLNTDLITWAKRHAVCNGGWWNYHPLWEANQKWELILLPIDEALKKAGA